MNKYIVYIVGLMLFAVGCKKNTLPGPGGEVNSTTPIELGVAVAGGGVTAQGVQSRALGVIDGFDDFGEDTLAVYGINEEFSGVQKWARADRVIDTTGAKISAMGKILFSGEKKYYPASGYLSVYALYPSDTSYVKIIENADGKVPSAEVTLKADVKQQYDVMLGVAEKLTIAQSQKAKVVFNHTLAQLKFKVYRVEEEFKVPTVTTIKKVSIRAVSKAMLDSVSRMKYTTSTSAKDSLDLVLYDNATGINVTATSSATAQSIGLSAMLFPGLGTVNMVTLTIDGIGTYTTPIPKTWELNQGKINTLTLKIYPFGVRLEDKWTIEPWGNGTDVSEGLENNGKTIRVSAPMINNLGGAYTGVMPVKADVEINGDYTHKGLNIESTSGSVFTTAPFNSGSLNNEPLYMTAITLYSDNDCNVPVFQGKLYGGKLSSGQKVVIDTINSGRIKVGSLDGTDLKLNISFGGMGNGTPDVPYEVATPLHLKNVENFKGRAASSVYDGTSTNGAVFKQMEDIDLDGINWKPIGQSGTTKAFFGQYFGNGKVIKNLSVNVNIQNVGLFGYVQKPNNLPTTIDGVVIVNGSVRGKAAVGGVIGYVSGAVVVSNCYNGASVTSSDASGTGVGGVIGNATSGSPMFSGLVNAGAVTSTIGVGISGIVGQMLSGTITNSYNAGAITGLVGSDVGGVIGYSAMGVVVSNCYNRAVINPVVGVFIGSLFGTLDGTTTIPAAFGNNYFLQGTNSKGVGSNRNNMGSVLNPYTSKTESELKGLATTLGSVWTDDYTDPAQQINGGYPILTWQKK